MPRAFLRPGMAQPTLSAWYRRVRLYILVGAVIDCGLAAGWEQLLQHAFPAPMPPRKGYMKYLKPADKRPEESAAVVRRKTD